ncbi:MAG: alpha-N-arabinofuranosidase, partial [Verrucomicrobiota bacterium]
MSTPLPSARLSLDPTFALTDIDPRLFANFVEYPGRCVYVGIYVPNNPTAMPDGWRGDVLALARELAPPIVRYPGGNFVSAYNWEDGVGPREQRPRRLDFAWRTTETNQVGTNEFVDWCRLVGAQPLMAVNLGTRGIED